MRALPLPGTGRLATSAPSAATILIVEDDAGIAGLLAETLQRNGFAARIAANGAQMDTALADGNIDLILLDVMLPGETGTHICARLRRISQVPIILLTALAEDIDRIVGLELGADDYVTKPFNSRELIARIRTILRRSQGSPPPADTAREEFHFAGWRLCVGERQLYGDDGVRIILTSAELDLLIALCLNAGRPLSRDELLDLTRSGAAGPTDRTIDVHISRIRQKIERDPKNPILIRTVRLGGYQFTSAVESL